MVCQFSTIGSIGVMRYLYPLKITRRLLRQDVCVTGAC